MKKRRATEKRLLFCLVFFFNVYLRELKCKIHNCDFVLMKYIEIDDS